MALSTPELGWIHERSYRRQFCSSFRSTAEPEHRPTFTVLLAGCLNRLRANKRALVSLYIVIVLLLFTVFGPVVWPIDPAMQDIDQISQPPGTDRTATLVAEYEPWFGTSGLPGAGLRLAEKATSQAVRLQWDALDGASGHRVYRNLFPVGPELSYGIPMAEFLNNDTLYFEDRLDLQPGRFYYVVVALDGGV